MFRRFSLAAAVVLVATSSALFLRGSSASAPCFLDTPESSIAAYTPGADARAFVGRGDNFSEPFSLEAGPLYLSVHAEVERERIWDPFQSFRVQMVSPKGEWLTIVSGQAPYDGSYLLTVFGTGAGDWRIVVHAEDRAAWTITVEQ